MDGSSRRGAERAEGIGVDRLHQSKHALSGMCANCAFSRFLHTSNGFIPVLYCKAPAGQGCAASVALRQFDQAQA